MEPGEAETLARELGVKFFRACVKENFNVDNVFDYLVDQWSKGSNKAQPAMDIRELAAESAAGGGRVPAAAAGSAAAGGKMERQPSPGRGARRREGGRSCSRSRTRSARG